MSEQPPSPEKKEMPEILEEEVIVALKTPLGIEDPKVYELLQNWTDQEEKKLPKTPEAMIEFTRRRARVYLAAGYIEEAFRMLDDARQQAWQENKNELVGDISSEMDAIEEKYS